MSSHQIEFSDPGAAQVITDLRTILSLVTQIKALGGNVGGVGFGSTGVGTGTGTLLPGPTGASNSQFGAMLSALYSYARQGLGAVGVSQQSSRSSSAYVWSAGQNYGVVGGASVSSSGWRPSAQWQVLKGGREEQMNLFPDTERMKATIDEGFETLDDNTVVDTDNYVDWRGHRKRRGKGTGASGSIPSSYYRRFLGGFGRGGPVTAIGNVYRAGLRAIPAGLVTYELARSIPRAAKWFEKVQNNRNDSPSEQMRRDIAFRIDRSSGRGGAAYGAYGQDFSNFMNPFAGGTVGAEIASLKYRTILGSWASAPDRAVMYMRRLIQTNGTSVDNLTRWEEDKFNQIAIEIEKRSPDFGNDPKKIKEAIQLAYNYETHGGLHGHYHVDASTMKIENHTYQSPYPVYFFVRTKPGG